MAKDIAFSTEGSARKRIKAHLRESELRNLVSDNQVRFQQLLAIGNYILARTPSADGIKGCSVRAQVLADFRYLQATVSLGFATENAFMSLNVPSKMRARDIFSIQRSRFWHSFLFKTRWFVHGFARRPWCGCTQGMHF